MTKAQKLGGRRATSSTMLDPTPPVAPSRHEGATTARLSQVVANPDNPRGQVGDVSDLVAGFESDGQIQPITVVLAARYLETCPEAADVVGDAVYVAVTGARRIAAARKLGWASIDVVVKNEYAASRGRVFMAAFLENFQRENVAPSKLAEAVRRFVDEFGMPKGEVAAKFGRSNAWVTREYRIGGLTPELLAEYDAERVTKEDADEIGKRQRSEQAEVWEVIRAARESGDKRKAADILRPDPDPEPGISRRETDAEPATVAVEDGSTAISRRETVPDETAASNGQGAVTTAVDTTVVTETEPVTETTVHNGNGSVKAPSRVQGWRPRKPRDVVVGGLGQLAATVPHDQLPADVLELLRQSLSDEVVRQVGHLIARG